jgi:predicted peroxiredoxin
MMHTAHRIEPINAHIDEAAPETLVVMLTAGNDDGGKRATLAYMAATCAAALDKRAIMFLVGDGAHWAYEGRTSGVKARGFPALDELVESLLEMGGEIYICSACDQVCGVPSDDEQDVRRHPSVKPRGMSAVLADMTAGQCVTF